MANPILTKAVLKKFAPDANAAIVGVVVNGTAALEEAGITTPLRAAHFLAQVAVETQKMARVEENLNYSVELLRKTFGKSRISDADCQKLGRTPSRPANKEAIANTVYGGDFGRTQLGNTQPGDGWKYRGGGMLQTTGRANYRKAGHEEDPETLRDPDSAFHSALHEWKTRGCNAQADKDDVKAVRMLINGGTNGLAECKTYLKEAKKALGI